MEGWHIAIFIALLIVVWLGVAIHNLYLISRVTSFSRGDRSERRVVLKLLKLGVHPQAIFHDLYLSKNDGTYTQIDLAVATPQGIIVIEVKDYAGLIYGHSFSDKWLQILAGGRKKHKFYNPVKQNAGHIYGLKRHLAKCGKIQYHSIVVFDGNCRLKNIEAVPDDVYVVRFNKLAWTIRRKHRRDSWTHYTDKGEIMRVLTEAVANGDNEEIVKDHVKNVKRHVFFKRFRWITRWFR